MKAVQDPTSKIDEDQTGFAFNAEVGGHFMFMKYLGGGLVFDFGKGFIGKMESTREYDAFGFSVALSVKGKLPL
jgi:hypothetical protein